MGFRFRLGPFTFGRTGTRLSLWFGGVGISIPLTGKGRTFGKVSVGPVGWYDQSGEMPRALPREDVAAIEHTPLGAHECAALDVFRADQIFLGRLRQLGMPWRGVQERLKEGLPYDLPNRDRIAYGLVPRAMSITFGQQVCAWGTEKRPSKSGTGQTTWIVVK
jgi:hypothetical protein